MTTQKQATVVRLEVKTIGAPSKKRVQLIRDWYETQATAEHEPVAVLNLAITAAGKIHTAGIAIEPEHALIMLGELEAVAFTLRSYVETHLASQPPSAELVRFNRRA